jgi:hypothetical protein
LLYLSEKSQELTDLIDGTIGELSMFQDTHGIYAHGVGKETAVLPAGWEDRLVALSGSRNRSPFICCKHKDSDSQNAHLILF